MMARVYIGVGANINPRENVREALRQLKHAVRIVGISTFYRTAPLGRPEQPPFINGVIAVETELPPLVLKSSVLRRIEEALGRQRRTDKYAARPIDLDMLVYDALVQVTEELVLPDPDITQRAFLAIPLCELAPELVLPDTGRCIREIAASFAVHTMEPLMAYTEELRKEIADGLPEG